MVMFRLEAHTPIYRAKTRNITNLQMILQHLMMCLISSCKKLIVEMDDRYCKTV